MINYIDILNDKVIIERYSEIDKQNKYPFNHGYQHIKNVCNIMNKLCDALNVDTNDRQLLLIACALHDIGQVNGRENHGKKAMKFSKVYLDGKISKEEDMQKVLSAIENHDQKYNLIDLPLFTNLVCFADKMDFTKNRLEKDYEKDFGHIVYDNVEDTTFNCVNDEFILQIITDGNISACDLLEEGNFFWKVINATSAIANKLNFNYKIHIDKNILDLDKEFIDIAIKISKNVKYPYGAIVVKDNKIIGRSDDETLISTSMYSHAELEAIESASKNKNLYGDLKGAIMYVSCEPCMMCMGAILYEEFSKIVYAATLEDSNDNYCPEIIVPIEELAKYSKSKIEIAAELHREQAVNVIKERN